MWSLLQVSFGSPAEGRGFTSASSGSSSSAPGARLSLVYRMESSVPLKSRVMLVNLLFRCGEE